MRYPPLKPEALTPAQKRVHDSIAGGPRGGVRGPFAALLRSPEVADRVQKVGEYLRYGSSVPARLNEFAILINARFWDSQYEWYAHHPFALKGGLKPEIAAEVAAGRRPQGMQEDEAAVYDFCTALHRDHAVDDATFARATKALGEQGVIDLIAVSGYYTLVSMVLNVAQIPLPEGAQKPW